MDILTRQSRAGAVLAALRSGEIEGFLVEDVDREEDGVVVRVSVGPEASQEALGLARGADPQAREDVVE